MNTSQNSQRGPHRGFTKAGPLTRLVLLSSLLLTGTSHAQSEIAADFAAIIGANGGGTATIDGGNEAVGIFGPDSFPVLVGENHKAIVAAGRTTGEPGSPIARAVVAGHGIFMDLDPSTTTSSIFENSVLWAGKQADRASTTVAVLSQQEVDFFASRGFATKRIDTSMQDSTKDLSGCDVMVTNFENNFTDNAKAKINEFVTAGGGIVGGARPWVVDRNTERYDFVQDLLFRFGLVYGRQTPGSKRQFTVPTAVLSENHNGTIALLAMRDHLAGIKLISAEELQIAQAAASSLAVSEAVQAATKPQYEALLAETGWIVPSEENVISVNQDPISYALVKLQNGLIDNLPVDELFIHPAAADIPGLPAPDASPVSKELEIDGTTPPSGQNMMHQRGSDTWRMTGLYAAPGDKVTIRIPANLVDAGLDVIIGATDNDNNERDEYKTMPKLWRKFALDAEVNEVGHAMGGLLSILVPPGSDLGTFNVTISGAIEAPHFELGVHTMEDWTQVLSQHPAPWGYLIAGNITILSPAARLREVANMQELAEYWRDVIKLGDEYYGYTEFRQREELVATNRNSVSSGIAYAGYPHELSWGIKDQQILDFAKEYGDWGVLHEIGHAYQGHLNQSFTFARNLDGGRDPETDVNLFPAMVFDMLHGFDSWHPNADQHVSAINRWNDRLNWEELPESERTWGLACDRKNVDYDRIGYDFFFNLSEAFGWDTYKVALSRLARWQSGQPDAELDELRDLDLGKLEERRNWFYVIFCDAAQRNLDQYFQYYGLGVPGLGNEIQPRAKEMIAAKNYEAWSGNRPLSGLDGPQQVTVPEDQMIGSVIATFVGDDPEPGTVFTYSITDGNETGIFSIDQRSGDLKLVSPLDFETQSLHSITIRCQDNGVPRYELSRTIDIVVENVMGEAAEPINVLMNFDALMEAGTDLGTLLRLDPEGQVASASFFGVPEGALSLSSSGRLILDNPAALDGRPYHEVLVTGLDDAGNEFSHSFRLSNGGLREQRWDGQERFNSRDWSGSADHEGVLPRATTEERIDDDYTRRLTGWLVPPSTGDYVFTIAGDDAGRILLSPNADESAAITIGSISSWTGFEDFDSGSVSQPVLLERGRAYWFEVHQAENGGNDHISVAWEGPGIAGRQVIGRDYLIPGIPSIHLSHNLRELSTDYRWGNPAGGSWADASNWANETVPPPFAGATLDFSALDLTEDATVTLDANRLGSILRFGDTDSSHSWTINSGSSATSILTLVSFADEIPVIDVQNGGPGRGVTINAVLAGQDGFTKTGDGTLTLSGANTYSGTTVVEHLTNSSGISGLVIDHANALGTSDLHVLGRQLFNNSLQVSSGITVANDLRLSRGAGSSHRAVLRLEQNSSWTGDIVIDSTNKSGFAVFSAGGSNWQNAPVVSGNISGLSLGESDLVDLYLRAGRGRITGSVDLPNAKISMVDSTWWEFSNDANTWSELSVDNSGARLYAGATNTLAPHGSLKSNSAGSVYLNEAGSSVAYDQTIGGLDGNLNVRLDTGAATLTLNTDTNHAHDGTITGAISLVKDGPATQTLGGTNTFTGSITVRDGTLRLTSATALPAESRIEIFSTAGSPIVDLGGLDHAVEAFWIDGVRQPDRIVDSSDPFFTGQGSFTVGSPSSLTAFEAWMATAGLRSGQPGTGPMESADRSGTPNLQKFALGGKAADPTANGIMQIFGRAADGKAQPVVTIAVRDGANFAGTPSLVAEVDGIEYMIEAGTDFSSWTLALEEVPAEDGGSLVAPSGYTLKSFRPVQAPSSVPVWFLRVRVNQR